MYFVRIYFARHITLRLVVRIGDFEEDELQTSVDGWPKRAVLVKYVLRQRWADRGQDVRQQTAGPWPVRGEGLRAAGL